MIERVRAIESILRTVRGDDFVLSTTGMISREVFARGDRPGNFYMLGSMGLLSSFGLGLALTVPSRKVFILEGDGSALMSLGTLPLIAVESPPNLVHVVLDNEGYESTGGQPSISAGVSLADVGRSSGYKNVARVSGVDELDAALAKSTRGVAGPHLIVVKCSLAPLEGIPRVSVSPVEIRDRFKSCVIDALQSKWRV